MGQKRTKSGSNDQEMARFEFQTELQSPAASMGLKLRLTFGGFGLSPGGAEAFRDNSFLRAIFPCLGFGPLSGPLTGRDLPSRLTLANGRGQSVGLCGDSAEGGSDRFRDAGEKRLIAFWLVRVR